MLGNAWKEFTLAAEGGSELGWLNLANVAFLQKDYDLALKYYQYSKELSASDYRAELGLARTFYELEDFRKSMAAYGQVQSLEPELANKYAYLASLAGGEGRAWSYADRLSKTDWAWPLLPPPDGRLETVRGYQSLQVALRTESAPPVAVAVETPAPVVAVATPVPQIARQERKEPQATPTARQGFVAALDGALAPVKVLEPPRSSGPVIPLIDALKNIAAVKKEIKPQVIEPVPVENKDESAQWQSVAAKTPSPPVIIASAPEDKELAQIGKDRMAQAAARQTPAPAARQTPAPVTRPDPVRSTTPEPLVMATPVPLAMATPVPVVVATRTPGPSGSVLTPVPQVLATKSPSLSSVATVTPVPVAVPEKTFTPSVTMTPPALIVAAGSPIPTSVPQSTLAPKAPLVTARPDDALVVAAVPSPTPAMIVLASAVPEPTASNAPVVTAQPEDGRTGFGDLVDLAKGRKVLGRWMVSEGVLSQLDPKRLYAKYLVPVTTADRGFRLSFEARGAHGAWTGFGLHILTQGLSDPYGYGAGTSVLLWIDKDARKGKDPTSRVAVYRSWRDTWMDLVKQKTNGLIIDEWNRFEVLVDLQDAKIKLYINGKEGMEQDLAGLMPRGPCSLVLRSLSTSEFRNFVYEELP